MKSTLYSLLILLLTAILTGCSTDLLTSVEPDDWQKREFETSVRNAVRKAIQAPGIDNGSTIVVTSAGDTLIAPPDSVIRATPTRTVYIEIQSPEYPRRISRSLLEMFTVSGVVIVICILVLIVILMVFITVLRRQNTRNKIISKAIDSGYPLPESFYTGQPRPATIKVTQLFEKRLRTPQATEKDDSDPSLTEEKAMEENLRTGLPASTSFNTTDKIKTLRSSFLLIGIGIVLFISFAAGGNPEVGFFLGGTAFVIGGAKLLTLYLSKKF